MLLLVDNEQTKARELDGLAEQGMRTDDDVERAVLDAGLDFGELLGANEPRGAADANRQPFEALDECLVVLAREQSRGDDDGNLQACHGGDEGRAQADLGLAETDIAAHEAVDGTT